MQIGGGRARTILVLYCAVTEAVSHPTPCNKCSGVASSLNGLLSSQFSSAYTLLWSLLLLASLSLLGVYGSAGPLAEFSFSIT